MIRIYLICLRFSIKNSAIAADLLPYNLLGEQVPPVRGLELLHGFQKKRGGEEGKVGRNAGFSKLNWLRLLTK